MAITLIDQPYQLTPYMQRLYFVMSSNNQSENGFKIKASVYDVFTGETYEYFLSREPSNRFIFDLAPLVNLRRKEPTNNYHARGVIFALPNGDGWNSYNITFSEYWIVAGVLTHNEEADETFDYYVYDAAYQISNGYKPNPDSVSTATRLTNFSMGASTAYIQSVRYETTHTWQYADTFLGSVTGNKVYIPSYTTDWGLFQFPHTDRFITETATQMVVEIYGTSGLLASGTRNLVNDPFICVPAYPANLLLDIYNTTLPNLNDYLTTWTCYVVYLDDGKTAASVKYVFYNAEKYGQNDCRHDYVRIGFVNSRGGWDYFNFIKKNEQSWDFDRKQYVRALRSDYQYGFSGGNKPFRTHERQLTDRIVLGKNKLTITSDWITENEYKFLRELMLSKEVSIIQLDGTSIPVSIIDTSFTERRERNGKLYNVTLQLKYSQQYWSN